MKIVRVLFVRLPDRDRQLTIDNGELLKLSANVRTNEHRR